ncbi:MAG: proline dehydrogenase family protein [Bryobacteraceae bacterium]
METWPVARKFTKRFVAGETLDEALAVCASLQGQGILATLDHLGESVTSLAQAAQSCASYMDALAKIYDSKLPATVSIKLTQFGLDLSEEVCLNNVRRLVAQAKTIGDRVEIDMESSAYTDRTLRMVSQLAEETGAVRSVIQAYLFRSAADVDRLNQQRIPVRLVKGAYDEPTSVAYASKREVDRNYVTLMKTLLDRGVNPAIGTHDENIVGEAFRYARERHIASDQFEFQMLYGIRRNLQQRIVDLGYRLRLYVPYGTEWYPYFMRRLAERPANALFVLRNLFR